MTKQAPAQVTYDDFYEDLLAIATIQDTLNKSMAGPDWMERAGRFIEDDNVPEDVIPLDYRAAILDETISELVKCAYNYEWWKPLSELDMSNAGVELVDILHFATSMELASEFQFKNRELEDNVRDVPAEFLETPHTYVAFSAAWAASFIANSNEINYSRRGFRSYVNSLISGVTTHEFSWNDYWGLCASLGFSPSAIIERYIFKASLNLFRTLNGYREKKYVKRWFVPMNSGGIQEIEDNDVMLAYCDDFKAETGRFPKHREIMEFLRNTYAEYKTNPVATA